MNLPGFICCAVELLLLVIGCPRRVSVLSARLASKGAEEFQMSWGHKYGQATETYYTVLNKFPGGRNARTQQPLRSDVR